MENPINDVDESKEKIDLLVPIAQEIVKIIGSDYVLLGNLTEEERKESYKPMNTKIMELLLEKNISYTDVKKVFQLVLQAYESVANFVSNSADLAYELSCKKLFGKDILDITFSDLDKILKS